MIRSDRRLRSIALMAAFLLCTASVSGTREQAGPPADTLCARTMRQLKERYSHFTAMKAHFTHALKATALNQDEVEEGTVYVERGGLMRWAYTKPEGKLAVSDGRNSYLYLPSENQVYVQPMARGERAPLALRLLTGNVDLDRDVECTKAYEMGKVVVLALHLMGEDEGIRDVEIAYEPSLKMITEVFYKDALGNQISLTLTDVTFPRGLDQRLFQFKVPTGARVIKGK